MSRKDNDKDKDELNEKEPWDQPIYEGQEKEEEVDVDVEDDGSSRTDRRVQEEGKNWYVIILVVLLFLIVLVPVSAILYFNMNTKMNEGKTAESSVVIEDSSKVAKKSSETKEKVSSSSTSSSSTSSTSSTSSESSKAFADVEVSPGEVQNNQNNAENAQGANNQQQAVAGGSSVSYGDSDANRSIWKISQTYGVDESVIYQLNPGLDIQNIQPGQQIRIK